ncbi:TetR/AcrR family transcriptional regulator C-terminal domain-containing protein [Nocardia goodfellowii]|uniref:TetR/AcrR family tetracycline transcriptional repressor n=1 Tax=Nocardia goodfellowii TaxID=882446 RepID=A0ABS4QMT5_9NOCA|nr:TetR/AcrR family transcriptional regulator C-terminal domain-containing protein [Nocardia goodfellowii]MBP2193019.1 TetR/AcrR family tetracycline transcriptional repressor [Nocardia goodfellowii]
MKLDSEAIATAALGLLDEVGLDGLTMRKVATALDVQAPTLYWHVKNKRELLDAMARVVFVSAVADLEAPRHGVGWQDWLADIAGRLRAAMLRYRDGAKLLAGTYVADSAMWRTVELALRTLEDAGFSFQQAARVFPLLLHYTTGFVIEEQARTGAEYADNPYRPELIGRLVDGERYPRAARMVTDLVVDDVDMEFRDGIRVILAGVEATRTAPERT